MADAIAWLSVNWPTIVGVTGSVVMGASIIVKAIAPFTATNKDDRAGSWLDKVHAWLSKVALNPPVK